MLKLEFGIEVCDLTEKHHGLEKEDERVGMLGWVTDIYVWSMKTLWIIDEGALFASNPRRKLSR